MATLVNLAIDAFRASRMLRAKHPRSCVSRAYYAAYAAVTSELEKDPGVTFGMGRGNPEHGRILDYVQQSFARRGYSQGLISRIKANLRDMRRDRERADYKPYGDVDESDAAESVRRAEQVIRDLRMPL